MAFSLGYPIFRQTHIVHISYNSRANTYEAWQHGVGKPNRKGCNAIPEASTFCRPKLQKGSTPKLTHLQDTNSIHITLMADSRLSIHIYPSFQVVIK